MTPHEVNGVQLQGRLTITVEEAGQVLGVSRRVAYDSVRRGEIPSLSLGRRLVVPVPKLLELVGFPRTDSEAPPASEATAQIRALPKSSGGVHYDDATAS